LVVAAVVFIVKSKNKNLLWQIPVPLVLLFLWMGLSIIWSSYAIWTGIGFTANLATAVLAIFLALQFDWRQLLNLVANTLRFIFAISFAIELLAVILGPIKPLFPYFEGKRPSPASYLWVQGNLFSTDRIQGFVGNANLLGFLAVLGLTIFFVEYIVSARNRKLSLGSMVLAGIFLVLAKSATMQLALVAVALAAIVAIFAEGRSKTARRRIYRGALGGAAFIFFVGLAYWSEITDLLGKSEDASGRFMIWERVFGLAAEKPLLGWGWVSHWVPGVPPFEGLVIIDKVPQYHAHNAFLDMFFQLGIIGLLLLIWLLVEIFVRLWRIAVRHTNPLYLWPLFVFLVNVAQSVAESRLLIENGWMFVVLLAIKSREPFENLEPVGLTPKLKKLLSRINPANKRAS
jgi:exopolysaccharide production protein ExoQ